MKIRALGFLLMLAGIALFYGCGGEPPTADLQAAEQALQSARHRTCCPTTASRTGSR